MSNEKPKQPDQPEDQPPSHDEERVDVSSIQLGIPLDPTDKDGFLEMLEQIPAGLEFDRQIDPVTGEEAIVVSITPEGLENLTSVERRKLGL